ncbi:hypothetical protein K1719_034369 [Acacia pycnantha]|nr:hypothetical protein K1719_034369 [Acacia pycnantha]
MKAILEGLLEHKKSDVFSFGVLLFEIISGRQNTSICDHEHSLNLLELAWKLWNEENTQKYLIQTISMTLDCNTKVKQQITSLTSCTGTEMEKEIDDPDPQRQRSTARAASRVLQRRFPPFPLSVLDFLYPGME